MSLPNNANVVSMTQREIDFWADVYLAGRVSDADFNLRFLHFLQNPWRHIHRLGLGDVPASLQSGYEPLLPAQRRVRDMIQSRDTGVFFAGRTEAVLTPFCVTMDPRDVRRGPIGREAARVRNRFYQKPQEG